MDIEYVFQQYLDGYVTEGELLVNLAEFFEAKRSELTAEELEEFAGLAAKVHSRQHSV